MMSKKRKILFAAFLSVFVLLHAWIVAFVPQSAVGTVWSLLPAVVVITMAVISREVFSSLLFGCISGGILICSSNSLLELPQNVFNCLIGGNDNKMGLLDVVSDSWNIGILLFLIFLGMLVDLVNQSGGRAGFSRWVLKRVKNRRMAMLITLFMGMIFFVDDYFNCLSVGTVMRPVTDSHKISRAKLAYLVDSTASPVCILMPLSSWVAAVSGYVSTENINGIDLFIKQIPFNFYSIMTLVMILLISLLNIDFGPMLRHEKNAQLHNDLFSSEDRPYADAEKTESIFQKGSPWDMLVPVFFLMFFCLFGILYTGGIFKGETFLNSFANADASKGLVVGSILAVFSTLIFLRIRGTVSFVESMQSLVNGVKHMAMPICVLVLAWLFGSLARHGLQINEFFAHVVGFAEGYEKFLPAFIFLMSIFLSFSTGTSWGTIAVMAPIAVGFFDYGTDPTTCVIALSAVCAGAVCGDHASPISDTTIMASTGAHCSLMDHVVTQLPYVSLVMIISFLGFLLTGFVQNQLLCLFMTSVLLFASLLVIKAIISVRHVGLFEEMGEANGDLKPVELEENISK